jgi:hypothetical protein
MTAPTTFPPSSPILSSWPGNRQLRPLPSILRGEPPGSGSHLSPPLSTPAATNLPPPRSPAAAPTATNLLPPPRSPATAPPTDTPMTLSTRSHRPTFLYPGGPSPFAGSEEETPGAANRACRVLQRESGGATIVGGRCCKARKGELQLTPRGAAKVGGGSFNRPCMELQWCVAAAAKVHDRSSKSTLLGAAMVRGGSFNRCCLELQ